MALSLNSTLKNIMEINKDIENVELVVWQNKDDWQVYLQYLDDLGPANDDLWACFRESHKVVIDPWAFCK